VQKSLYSICHFLLKLYSQYIFNSLVTSVAYLQHYLLFTQKNILENLESVQFNYLRIEDKVHVSLKYNVCIEH